MVNVDSIREHYKFLGHQKQTEIRIFSKDTKEDLQKVYTVSNEDQFINIILNNIKEDIGVGVHERSNGGIQDKNVTDLRFLVIDIDTKDTAIIKDCEKKLKENGFNYSAKIFTGKKGYHFYIPIKHIQEKDKIKDILENAKYYFIYDLNLPVDILCFNPSRIFRVWGSENKGVEVCIEFLDKDVIPIDAELIIPKRPDNNSSILINSSSHFSNQVMEDFPLFEALYKNPEMFPLKSDTNFNDEIVKNIAAYIQKKGIKNLEPWYKLMRLKKHPISNLHNWLKKPRFFNPFEVLGNIRKHYYDYLYKEYCINLKQLSSHSITYIDEEELNWKKIKNQYRNTNSFHINKQFKIEGNIIPIINHKMTFKLAKVYQSLQDPNLYHKIYLGEDDFTKGLSRKRITEMNVELLGEINANFYIYKLISSTNMELTLYSEEKLEPGYYLTKGTLMKFDDHYEIGQKSKQPIYSYVLVLHSYEKKELKFKTLEQLYNDFNVSGDSYYKYLMTETDNSKIPVHYKTNDFYKKIYTSFLFSGSLEKGQKLNLILFGPTGTGKTPQMRSISEKFNEKKCFSGTSMTVAGLTISFYGPTAKLGALLESRRICAIDEFFKIFNRMDDVSQITNANDYFDNQMVSANSGKSETDVKSTCQIFAVTNPIRRNNKSLGIRSKMSLREMFDYVDSDFWGRFLVINQTKEDSNWVLDPNNKEENIIVPSISRDMFIACYDFFKETLDIMNDIDKKRINKIVLSIQIPEDIEDVYKKVANRIPYLLFDGMVKWRIFCEKTKIEVKEVDYVNFESLWKEIILRWFAGEKDEYNLINLSDKEQDLLNEIKKLGEMTYQKFNDSCKLLNLDAKDTKDRLEKTKLIRKDIDKRMIYYDSDIDSIYDIDIKL